MPHSVSPARCFAFRRTGIPSQAAGASKIFRKASEKGWRIQRSVFFQLCLPAPRCTVASGGDNQISYILHTKFLQPGLRVHHFWGARSQSPHGMLVLSPSSGLAINSERVLLLQPSSRPFLLPGRPCDAALGRITRFLGACGCGAFSPCLGGSPEGRSVEWFLGQTQYVEGPPSDIFPVHNFRES
jgi:hypothetical protein